MAAATPKTPSDAQPTSENITYEATLNGAASASRFPAGAFLDYVGLKKILEALAEMYATGDRPTEGLAYASLATTAAAPRGPTSFHPQPLRGLLLGLERRSLGSSQAARLLRAARELTPVCPACPVGRAGAWRRVSAARYF